MKVDFVGINHLDPRSELRIQNAYQELQPDIVAVECHYALLPRLECKWRNLEERKVVPRNLCKKVNNDPLCIQRLEHLLRQRLSAVLAPIRFAAEHKRRWYCIDGPRTIELSKKISLVRDDRSALCHAAELTLADLQAEIDLIYLSYIEALDEKEPEDDMCLGKYERDAFPAQYIRDIAHGNPDARLAAFVGFGHMLSLPKTLYSRLSGEDGLVIERHGLNEFDPGD